MTRGRALRSGRRPRRSVARLLDQISRGQLRPGERLGAERDLATELGVSRSTVRQALAALEEAGVVRRVPGRGGGTFVRQQKVERDLSRVVGVPALLRQQGMTAGSRIVSTGMVAADDETARGARAGRGRLRHRRGAHPARRRHPDLARARAAARRAVPAAARPAARRLALRAAARSATATAPGEAVEHIEVVPAGEDEASILGVEPGAPLLSITRTTQDAGRPRVRVLARPVPRRPHHHHGAHAGDDRARDRRRAGRAAAPAGHAVSGRTALVVANATDADTGYVGERLEQRGYTLRTVMRDGRPSPGGRRRAGGPRAAARLRVVGARAGRPVGAGGGVRRWSATRATARLPVLGLCYGAQVLRARLRGCRGAGTPGDRLRARSQRRRRAGAVGPWTPFHLDVLDAPPDAQVIARNACGVQAFVAAGAARRAVPPRGPSRDPRRLGRAVPRSGRRRRRSRRLWSRSPREREPEARAAAHALVDAFLDRVATTAAH